MNLSDITSSLGTVIGVVCGCGATIFAIAISGFFIYRMFKGRAQTNALLQNGIPASATILSIQDTGWRINDQPQALVTLQVTPTDRPPFQAQVKDTFSPFDLGSLTPGAPAQVRFNPNDTSKVVIESLGGGMTASTNNMMAQNMMPVIPGTVTPNIAPPPVIPAGVPAMTTADGQPLIRKCKPTWWHRINITINCVKLASRHRLLSFLSAI